MRITLFSITSRPIAIFIPPGNGATIARTVAALHPSTTTSTRAVGPHALPIDGLDEHLHESPTLLTIRSASGSAITVLGAAVVTSVSRILSTFLPPDTSASARSPPRLIARLAAGTGRDRVRRHR